MIIERIELINFKKYTKQRIELGKKVIGIFGPNGAGKSTIFDAICWCLYGVTPTIGKEGEVVRQEELIRDGQSEMGVEIFFRHDQQNYDVSRFYSTTEGIKAKIIIDGEVVANSSKEVTSFITKLIGFDAKAFISASFVRQKEIDLLTSQRASRRKEIINRLFNLQLYDNLLGDARKKQKDLEMEVIDFNGQKKELVRDIESFSGVKDEQRTLKKRLQELREKIGSSNKKLSEEKEAYESLRQKHKAYEQGKHDILVLEGMEKEKRRRYKEYAELLAEIRRAREEIKEIEKKLKDMRVSKDAFNRLFSLRNRYNSLKYQIDALAGNVEDARTQREREHNRLKERLEALKTKQSSLEDEIQQISREIQAVADKLPGLEKTSASLQSARKELEKINNRIRDEMSVIKSARVKLEELREEEAKLAAIESESKCPTCHQPLDNIKKAMLRREYNVKLTKQDALVKNQESKLSKIEELGKEGREKVKCLETDLENYQGLKLQKTKLDSMLEQKKGMQKETRESIQTTEREIEAFLKEEDIRGKKIEEEMSRKLKELSELGFNQDEFERVQEEAMKYDKFRNQRDAKLEYVLKEDQISINVERITNELNELLDKIGKQKESLALLKVEKEDVERARSTVKLLEKGLKELEIEEGKIEQQLSSNKELLEKLSMKKERIREVSSKLKELNNSINDYHILKEAFKNIPVNIHERLKPRIQMEVSNLLSEITQEKYPAVRIEDDYTIQVLFNGIFYPIYRFSGGEKDLINLCLRIGISRVLASLSKEQDFAHLDYLFLDETFSSLDSERRKNLLSVLNTLQNFFSQIVVITHVEDIKEMVPDVIIVEEQDDGSSGIKYSKKI
ncbi:MAG: AAA family ATPase [Candidatus Methanofastidiosia archaeon]